MEVDFTLIKLQPRTFLASLPDQPEPIILNQQDISVKLRQCLKKKKKRSSYPQNSIHNVHVSTKKDSPEGLDFN